MKVVIEQVAYDPEKADHNMEKNGHLFVGEEHDQDGKGEVDDEDISES